MAALCVGSMWLFNVCMGACGIVLACTYVYTRIMWVCTCVYQNHVGVHIGVVCGVGWVCTHVHAGSCGCAHICALCMCTEPCGVRVCARVHVGSWECVHLYIPESSRCAHVFCVHETIWVCVGVSVHVCTWLCAGLRACVHVHVHELQVGTRAHAGRHLTWDPGGQPCRGAAKVLGADGTAAPWGSPWEKNSLKMGTPLKSPQSPQVWLAYLVSSSSWNERTCQTPGHPGREGQMSCGGWHPRGGAGGPTQEAGPCTRREAVSPSTVAAGGGAGPPPSPEPRTPSPRHSLPSEGTLSGCRCPAPADPRLTRTLLSWSHMKTRPSLATTFR